MFLKRECSENSRWWGGWASLSAPLNVKFFRYVTEKPLVKLRREEFDTLEITICSLGSNITVQLCCS